MMQDFYFEKTRASETEDWPDAFTLPELADALGVERVSYRIYYSKDNLTCRLFVFRPHCTSSEEQKMLDLGFVHAQDGDTENIPDKSKMNERIRQLADEAAKYSAIMALPTGQSGNELFVEKFAELIVRECAKSLWTEECHNSDLALEEFERNSAKIKEHFGVEE
jgi:hypothetical protein